MSFHSLFTKWKWLDANYGKKEIALLGSEFSKIFIFDEGIYDQKIYDKIIAPNEMNIASLM